MKIFAIKNRRTNKFVNFSGKNKVLTIDFSNQQRKYTASWDPEQPLVNFIDGDGYPADPTKAQYGILFFKLKNGMPVTQANLHLASKHIRDLCVEAKLMVDPTLVGYTADVNNPRFYTPAGATEKKQAGHYGRPMTAEEYAVAYPKAVKPRAPRTKKTTTKK
jgi:hypothetical protein